LFKEVGKFSKTGLTQKQQRVSSNNTGKVNLPYKMFTGMKNKSLERNNNLKNADRISGVVGSSGRDNKLMQNYFIKGEQSKKLEESKRLDLDKRGVNWHQNSLGVYRDGAINFSKEAIKRMEQGDIYGGAFKKADNRTPTDDSVVKIRKEKKERVRLNYDDIMKAKEDNDEFRTGKKFRKVRGAAGKIHRKHKSGGGKRKNRSSAGTKR